MGHRPEIGVDYVLVVMSGWGDPYEQVPAVAELSRRVYEHFSGGLYSNLTPSS